MHVSLIQLFYYLLYHYFYTFGELLLRKMMLRTLALTLVLLVVCNGRNLIREERQARLRKKSFPVFSPNMRSGSPGTGSPGTGSPGSHRPVSGYMSDPSEGPSEGPWEVERPIGESTFNKVAQQISSVVVGVWKNTFTWKADNVEERDLNF